MEEKVKVKAAGGKDKEEVVDKEEKEEVKVAVVEDQVACVYVRLVVTLLLMKGGCHVLN